MYIDGVGGGGNASMADGVPPSQTRNSSLSTGYLTVASVPLVLKRRADSPVPPGDGIYNSVDDQFLADLKPEMMESTVLLMISMKRQSIQMLLNGGHVMQMLIIIRNCWTPVTPWQISVSLTSWISFRPSPMFVR